MKYCKLIFAIVATFCIIACSSEYAPECGTRKESPSSKPVEKKLIVENVTFDSLSLLMSAKVNAADGTEITAVCNGKTQTAESVSGTIRWNMATSFYNGIKGGKEYEVAFTAVSGYTGTVKSQIEYWPKASYTLSSPDEITIYNGSAKTYQPPKYTINYDVAKVILGMTFKLYDKDDTKISEYSYPDWTLANMLDFLSKNENDGKCVKVHFSIIPKIDGGDLLAANGVVTYYCKADVLVKSVDIVQIYDHCRSFLSDKDGNEAGGAITYQWEKSEDGTNWAIIADVTGDVYVLPAEDVGFKLRLRIKQEYNESWQNELLSNVIDLTNTISINNAEFDSLTYNFKAELTSDIAIPNGTYITAICNNKTYSVGVSDSKVSFNLAESFLRGTKGGQNYSVTFSARGTKGDTVEIGYWPIVSYEITTPEEVTIYNGAADKFESPEWTLINYEPNSVTMNMWFKLYTNYGTDSSAEITSIDTSNWQLSDMKTFLTDLNNDGKTIEANFSITPNCTDGESLAADGYVVYHCKKDVLVKSAYIVNNYGDFEAHLYADETPSEESEAETAGGIVSYQWQISEDAQNYTDIPNATEKTFSLTKENADSLIRKALRVKITQNYEGQEHESIYSEGYAVYHKMVKSELYYDGVLIVGEDFDTSKIKGTVTDELGNVYDERGNWVTNGALYEKGYYTASVSKSFQVIMWKDLFYDTTLDVFAIVQNDLSEDELPSLSTDTYSINVGKVRFNSINKNLEISLDGGIIYEDFPDDEFNASAGQVLYLRKKAIGTPNTNGYIKESRPLTITVETKNVGRRTVGGGIISGFEALRFTLKKTSANGTVTVTPEFSYTENYWNYEFTWQIDGAEALSYNGVSENDTHALVIATSEFGKDSYQIFCWVRIYEVGSDPSDQYDLGSVSAQTSLVVE